MNVVWIVLGLAVAGALVAIAATRRRTRGTADLGAVSHQWIAEHRMNSAEESRR